uniref:SH2 domain-containing protein n=1 Tax=Megaselia scalaris TaxID=36166 RepID=T1GSR6_MEGSC
MNPANETMPRIRKWKGTSTCKRHGDQNMDLEGQALGNAGSTQDLKKIRRPKDVTTKNIRRGRLCSPSRNSHSKKRCCIHIFTGVFYPLYENYKDRRSFVKEFLGVVYHSLPDHESIIHVWYWGDISRKDAQKQLTDKPNGSFLVRDSETIDNQFTLSFRIGNHTLHYRLKYFENFWNFEDLKFDSIVEMIQDIIIEVRLKILFVT